MSKFAIFVTVRVAADHIDAFEAAILANATAAARDEPDCHMFRVTRNKDKTDTYHFLEIYTNEAALDTHRETPHFKTYSATVQDWILEKTIERLDVLQ